MRDTKNHATPDRTVEELHQATLNKLMALLRAGYTHRNVRVPVGPSGRKRACRVSVLRSFDLVPPLEPPWGLSWRTNRRGCFACRGWRGWGNTLRGFHLPLPVGEQELPLPHRSSADHHSIRRPIPGVVLWYRHRRHSSTRFVSDGLPVRSGKKLTFPLCRTCVQQQQAKPMLHRTHYCHHSDNDRMLRGSWCTHELVKAVEKGYTLVKIHEVLLFPEHQRRTGLFADYVNTWLKLKQELAGWSSWCQTVEQKREYILRYQEREGIRRDVSQIAKKSWT